MKREYHRWFSPNLGREMELLEFGHAGMPVIVFPTSFARYYEWEDRNMVSSLEETIDAGNIRMYLVDSLDQETWNNSDIHPTRRVQGHLAFEQYLLTEVLPFISSQAPDRADNRVATTGASLGAFHAALFAFRHPRNVMKMVSMSGVFENSRFLDGYSDQDTYFTNAIAFLPGLTHSHYLDPLRAMEIVIVAGREDPMVEQDIKVSEILWEKEIPHTLDLWDGWSHDWPYWQSMIQRYF
jgi:esterase/lipase superfamily enzyme